MSSTALEDIHDILEINLGSRSFQRLGLHQMSCLEPFFFFLVFFPIFKQVLLQLFRRLPEHCYVVKLQKCFAVYKTSTNFLVARGWVDNDKFYFIFGWTFSWQSRLKTLLFSHAFNWMFLKHKALLSFIPF